MFQRCMTQPGVIYDYILIDKKESLCEVSIGTDPIANLPVFFFSTRSKLSVSPNIQLH